MYGVFVMCVRVSTWCWMLNVEAGYNSRFGSFQGFGLDLVNKGEPLKGLKPRNKISFTKITLWVLLKI